MTIARQLMVRQYATTYPTILGLYSHYKLAQGSPSLIDMGQIPDANEATLARIRRNCVYIPEMDNKVDLDAWLQLYRPSQINKAEQDVRRIVAMGPADVHEFRPFDKAKVKDEWEAVQASGRPLTPKIVEELAEKVHYVSGKWMCFPSTGLKVDHYWKLIATATVRGEFGSNCTGAKVRPYQPQRRQAICIHNKHYNNFQEVKEIENKIRAIGLKCELSYKPDIYTELGFYAHNAYDVGFSSHMYRSLFDIKTGRSEIRIMYNHGKDTI